MTYPDDTLYVIRYVIKNFRYVIKSYVIKTYYMSLEFFLYRCDILAKQKWHTCDIPTLAYLRNLIHFEVPFLAHTCVFLDHTCEKFRKYANLGISQVCLNIASTRLNFASEMCRQEFNIASMVWHTCDFLCVYLRYFYRVMVGAKQDFGSKFRRLLFKKKNLPDRAMSIASMLGAAAKQTQESSESDHDVGASVADMLGVCSIFF